MVNNVLSKESTVSATIGAPGARRSRVLMLGAICVVVVAIVFTAAITTTDSAATTSPESSDALSSQVRDTDGNPALSRATAADAARLTALATAYEEYQILAEGRLADGARWQAIADSYGRSAQSVAAEFARLGGLAGHYVDLPAPLQAAADRYQGIADATK